MRPFSKIYTTFIKIKSTILFVWVIPFNRRNGNDAMLKRATLSIWLFHFYMHLAYSVFFFSKFIWFAHGNEMQFNYINWLLSSAAHREEEQQRKSTMEERKMPECFANDGGFNEWTSGTFLHSALTKVTYFDHSEVFYLSISLWLHREALIYIK